MPECLSKSPLLLESNFEINILVLKTSLSLEQSGVGLMRRY